EPRLDVLRVEGPGAHAAADRRAHDDGQARSPAPVRLREVVDDLVEAARDEVAELHLDHGDEAVEREAHRAPERARLDDRRVADAVLAELLDKPLGDLEDAA